MLTRINRLGLAILLVATLSIGVVLGSAVTLAPSRVLAQSSGDDTTLLQHIYQQVNPSVVNIQVTIPAGADSAGLIPVDPFQAPGGPGTPPPGGNGNAQSQPQMAEGSGFVFDTNRDIVTNAHVVQDASKIIVTFSDDTSLVATIVGIDPDADLAVVKIDPTKVSLVALTLGDSDALTVGDRAIAIGNPFGLAGTMTQGIISALGRSLEGQRSAGGQASNYLIPQVIQTDASINPGNSGGVLLNTKGEVVGVTSAIESNVRQSSGVGFAVPSNIVKKVVASLIKSGKIDHAFLGIAGTTLDLELNGVAGLEDNMHGVMVRDVTPDSPAAKAGVKSSTKTVQLDGESIKVGGDIIVGVDDVTVKRFEDLLSYLFVKTEPGQTIKLKIVRDGKPLELSVTLSARPTAN